MVKIDFLRRFVEAIFASLENYLKGIYKMHHKILRHLLALFFVVILLTIFGMQWYIQEKDPLVKEARREEDENYRFTIPAIPEDPEKPQVEIRIY